MRYNSDLDGFDVELEPNADFWILFQGNLAEHAD
jgi:hypothetical protein